MKWAWLILVGLVGCASANPTTYGGDCNTDDDCHTEWQSIPGTSCVDFKCVCDTPGFMWCCPGGDIEKCTVQPPGDLRCRPATECQAPDAGTTGAGGSGTGGAMGSGAGGTGGSGGEPLPPPECLMDADCPDPPDPACGEGKCIDSHCMLDIWEGPTTSQRYGDCKQVVCDVYGNKLEVVDVGDVYNDGNQCTYDACEGDVPKNEALPDGLNCPEGIEGYCYQGQCVECIAVIPYAQCASGLSCDASFYCVPFPACTMLGCGGLCAPCAVGYGCTMDADCKSGNCESGMCALPNCMNGKQDGSESGIDCGASSCAGCSDGEGCKIPTDCQSGVCMAGICQAPSCMDAVLNGMELGIDCGGTCNPCLP